MKIYLLLYIIFMPQLFAGIIHPPDGSKITYIHVMFEWEAIEYATEYKFELSRSNNFSTRLISTEVSDIQHLVTNEISWESTYYWRVKALDGNWMDTYSFTTGHTRSDVTVIMHDESLYAYGYTIFGSADGYYSAIIDKYGDEIWNSGSDNIIYYNFLDDERFYGARYDETLEYPYPGIKFSLTDGIVWEEPNADYVHHEFIELPWGDYMGIAHVEELGPIFAPIGGTYWIMYQGLGFQADGITNEYPWWGDRLVIWDKDTKAEKWSWSTFDYFNISDYDSSTWSSSTPIDEGYYDWTHMNAFYFDDRDNSIYISTRNLSRITKLQYPSGEIIWNMGHESESGDVDFGHDLGFSYQHSISLTDADNILILDNGVYAQNYWNADEPTTRALEIAVEGSDGNYSASLAFEYILPSNLYGLTAGNAQQLENGNYLITTMGNNGTSLEVTSSGILVWEANYASALMWRASRIQHCNVLGDLSGDDFLNVLDIVIVANCILIGNCADLEYSLCGDINYDGIYNVLDIVVLANCILNPDCNPSNIF